MQYEKGRVSGPPFFESYKIYKSYKAGGDLRGWSEFCNFIAVKPRCFPGK